MRKSQVDTWIYLPEQTCRV